MKRFVYYFLLSAITVIALYGCEKKFIDYGSTETPFSTGPVSFATEILPIFTAKCILCHGNGGQTPVLVEASAHANLSSYVNTADPANSTIYLKLTALGSSHEGRATDTEEALILQWITQGALNN